MADNGRMKNQKEVTALRRRVNREREAAGARRVRFSEELRRDVLAVLARRTWRREPLAKAVGLAPSVVHRWARKPPDERCVQHPRKSAGLKRVQIVRASASDCVESLELELASGARVRGLTLEQLAWLMGVKP
jgi:hypothetical protein